MKILVITTLYPTSPETRRTDTSFAVHNFAKYWKDYHELLVIKVSSFGIKQAFSFFKHLGEYNVEGVSVKNVPLCMIDALNYKSVALGVTYIYRYLERICFFPEVVVSHCSTSHLLACKLNTMHLNAPHVCGIHKADVSKLAKKESGFEPCFLSADLLAFRSTPIKNMFIKTIDVDKLTARCITTNSGIEADFIANRDFIKAKINKDRSTIKIATIGALIPLKKIDVIIKALQSIDNKNWIYQIAGDGPERKKLEQIAEVDHDDRIKFTGYLERPEIEELLQNTDVFVLVSERETFGLVYLEALAKGCVVVGSKGWGIDGVVVNGKNGFLCEPNNQEQLTHTLEHIMSMTKDEFVEFLTAGYRSALELEEEKVALQYLNEIVQITKKTGT